MSALRTKTTAVCRVLQFFRTVIYLKNLLEILSIVENKGKYF